MHTWSWGRSWQGSSLAPPSLLERVTQKPWPNSTLTYFDMYTNQLFSDSTCAEPYCVSLFLFKRDVYLAIIINKWIFFSEVTVHASWWPFSPGRSQQGSPVTCQIVSLSGSARLSQPPDLLYIFGGHAPSPKDGFWGVVLRQFLSPKSTCRGLGLQMYPHTQLLSQCCFLQY